MDWLEILQKIIVVCIVPLCGVLIGKIIDIINVKKIEIKEYISNENANKYIDLIANTITECVIATNQTYVDSLKDKNLFDSKAQKIAFDRTFNAVLNILSEDALDYLAEIYGDVSVYLTNKIEAEVKLQNKGE